MNKFFKEIDKRSRKVMVEFLSKHYRYHTANSWNNATSYAHNMKIYNLGLSDEVQSKLYELMEVENFFDNINNLIYDFDAKHDHQWQAGFNGGAKAISCCIKARKNQADIKVTALLVGKEILQAFQKMMGSAMFAKVTKTRKILAEVV